MKKLIVFIFLVLSFQFLFPQAPGKNSKLLLNLDYSRFMYDETSAYVEFYYSIYPNLEMEELKKIENVKVNFNLYNDKDQLEASSPILVNLEKYKEKDSLKINETSGLIKTVLKSGSYRIDLTLMNNFHVFDSVKTETAFEIKSFVNDKITLSDLEIAKSIKRSNDKKSDYYKNTLEVIPNPMAYIPMNTDKIGYYIELYNVNKMGEEGEIDIASNVVDLDGQIKASKSYSRKKNNSSYVELGFLDISGLETGYYTLIFSVSDEKEDYAIYRKKLFYIDHPGVKPVAAATNLIDEYEQSEFYFLPGDMINDKIKQAMYLLTTNEKKVVKKFKTVDAKRKWLYEFWKRNMMQNINFKDKFEERIQFVNRNFSNRGREGWKTDRGRIYITYGKPDERNRYPSDSEKKPYEVWKYYNLQGGVEFNFVDENGFGDYRLVNSTHKNEVYDPNWEDYLY